MKIRRYQLLALAVVLLLAVLLGAVAAAAQGDGAPGEAVVLLIAADEGRGGQLVAKWTGSGVIISPDGLILTNCQVASPRSIWDERQFDYDLLIVSLAVRPGEPPQPTYVAEVVQSDAALDLAVVRITQTLDGSPVRAGSLSLPSATMGDSDSVQEGDVLSVLGYAGAGSADLLEMSSQVTGFASGRGVTGRAWVRTDATLEGGLSGAPAFNSEGSLVAMVAVGAAGSADDVLHCRFIDDTNGDGKVDYNDTCAATGGSTSALRPANLAGTMIQAAGLGIEAEPTALAFPTSLPKATVGPVAEPTAAAGPTPQPLTTGPRLGRTIFAPAVDEYDQPVTVSQFFPSGSEDIYFIFDYAGLEPGVLFQPVLVYEGETYDDIWQAEGWYGDTEGTSWVSIHNEPLAEGLYEFVLLYDEQELGSASVQVGGQATGEAVFSSISFTAGGYEGYVLPAGVDEVQATFDYENMTAAEAWSYVWYRQGEEIDSGDGQAMGSSAGTASLALTGRGGVSEGLYRLDLYVGNRLAATADFLAVSLAGGQDLFGPITFAEGVDRHDAPVGTAASFDYGITELYAFFDYQGMQDGWEWTRQWYLDGEAITSMDDTWQYGSDGQHFWVSIGTDGDPLPRGEYTLELYVEGELVQQAGCTISGGAAPTPTPTAVPAAEGVEFYGTIYDAATGRGIKGAFIIVLQPGITSDEFTWDEDQVYTWAETDQWGYYELPLALVRGETYSIVVGADGYLLVAEDDVFIGQDAESSYMIDIALSTVR